MLEKFVTTPAALCFACGKTGLPRFFLRKNFAMTLGFVFRLPEMCLLIVSPLTGLRLFVT
ncbi:MAG: hypothetical protein IKZ88_05935 [Neisseriaceae bacterium]|nr:hypothetical protein [Neisseriaceae bacterium]